MNLPINQIVCGDNVETLQTFPNECIDLVVTSPPYGEMRSFGGCEWDFEGLSEQLWRVIKPGGMIVWVCSDETKNGSESGESFLQALHFKSLGFLLWDTMIWTKPNPSVPTESRYYNAWEFMFCFSKGKPKAMNFLKMPTVSPGSVEKKASVIGKDNPKNADNGETYKTPETTRRLNVWSYSVGKGQSSKDAIASRHRAIFPEQLARDHILSWSNEGDLVCDVFNGSGTTTKMAKHNGRNYIGIEVNPDYCEIAENRLRQQVLF